MTVNYILTFSLFLIIIMYMLYLNHSSIFVLKTNSFFTKFLNNTSKFFFVYLILSLIDDIFIGSITLYTGVISICKILTFLYVILILNKCIITKRLIVHNGNVILRKNITNYCLNGSVLEIKTKDITIKIDLTDDIKESVLSKVKVTFK